MWCSATPTDDCKIEVDTNSLICRYIAEQLGERCRYHLQLNGWFFQSSGQFCLVMEPGKEDLLVALRRGMSKERRMLVAVDIAKALEAMHKIGYVYQDLKPQNVMVQYNY